ncbi:B- and T-lymphocyte attenuator, partial [Dissostichus eleginoides]
TDVSLKHENTSYKAVVGEYLEIECKVVFCEKAQPTVDWIKLDDGRGRTTVPQKNESSTNSEPTVDSWMYFAAGIVPFIIIAIIISVVLMRGRKAESVPIMRPNLCWVILHVCIWAGLLLTLNADEECFIETKVHVDTSYKAVVGEQLELKCEVAFCEEAPPTVDWIKREQTDVPVNISSSSHIKTHWEFINKSEGISFLVFPKIRLNDSGEYQCQTGGSSSHNINVFVYGSTNSEPTVDSWMYFAAGIVPFIIIAIIIPVVLMRGRKGESKNETQTEVQYIAIPAKQPIPHGSLQPSPRTI